MPAFPLHLGMNSVGWSKHTSAQAALVDKYTGEYTQPLIILCSSFHAMLSCMQAAHLYKDDIVQKGEGSAERAEVSQKARLCKSIAR